MCLKGPSSEAEKFLGLLLQRLSRTFSPLLRGVASSLSSEAPSRISSKKLRLIKMGLSENPVNSEETLKYSAPPLVKHFSKYGDGGGIGTPQGEW